ncbi:hypothetical protein GOP47_0001790 [Adiantum capillus-veneris]|uniref:BHLH domain-containing protein n=1 Tax=Adiantum capillus-veneris TaxID=13818 RepID=A0A9D4VAR5_ADICA|nr:hypothetical protein GOP47_0001790 [Adiantum capillus-veneris]
MWSKSSPHCEESGFEPWRRHFKVFIALTIPARAARSCTIEASHISKKYLLLSYPPRPEPFMLCPAFVSPLPCASCLRPLPDAARPLYPPEKTATLRAHTAIHSKRASDRGPLIAAARDFNHIGASPIRALILGFQIQIYGMEVHQQLASFPSGSGGAGDLDTSGTMINWLLSELELDLHQVYHTPAIGDDLSRLVASSNPISIALQEASSTSASVCLSPRLELSAVKELMVSYVLEPADQPLQGSSGTPTFSPKIVSLGNISFAHPQPLKIEETTLCGRARRKKASSAVEVLPNEKMQIVGKLFASMEDSTSFAGNRDQLTFRDWHKKVCRVEQQLLGCIKEDGFLHPRIEPAQQMQTLNFIGVADSTNTVPNASILRKSDSHVLAERRRREKLNQRFVALSAILPGLKKVDKASILGDAIKYVKQLEEHLKQVETQHSCSKNNTDESIQPADIEARAFGNNVLIHVHCNKIKNILVRCLELLDKMPLLIINANVLSFSDTALDLTVIAQIEQDSDLTANDIVEALQTFFSQFQY